MKPRITRSPAADADIDHIADYFTVESLDIALRFIDALAATENILATMPLMGTKRDFYASELSDMRMTLVKDFENYLIFYQPTEYGIHVVRLLHGARDIEAIFE